MWLNTVAFHANYHFTGDTAHEITFFVSVAWFIHRIPSNIYSNYRISVPKIVKYQSTVIILYAPRPYSNSYKFCMVFQPRQDNENNESHGENCSYACNLCKRHSSDLKLLMGEGFMRGCTHPFTIFFISDFVL